MSNPETAAAALAATTAAGLVAGAMALRGTGTVVHISSDAAVEAYPNWGAYGASKAALDHLNRTFAAEVPGVRFLSVDPGEMNTRMHAGHSTPASPSSLDKSTLFVVHQIETLPPGFRTR